MTSEYLRDETLPVGKQIKKAVAAYQSAHVYISAGLLIGFSLVAIEHGINHLVLEFWVGKTRWYASLLVAAAFILGHLGVGFIVAALAVFFYEWGAHIKDTLHLTNKLVLSLGHAKLMMDAIQMSKTLRDLNVATADQRLHHCIQTLIGGGQLEEVKAEHLRRAASNCEKLIRAIANLDKRHQEGVWANDQYIAFIAKHTEEIVGHNAEAFSKMLDGWQSFKVPPTAAQMADDILTAQMRAMKTGDQYCVISDLASWEGNQLEDLYNETRIAIEDEDVLVRRVFNLLPYIYSPRPIPPGIRDTLRKHLRASENWKGRTAKGGYEIKLLWPDGYNSKLKKTYSLEEVRNSHFGLFIHQPGSESVRFTVTHQNLSDIVLCRQEQDNKPFVNLFESVWKVAKPFPCNNANGEPVQQILDRLSSEREKEERP